MISRIAPTLAVIFAAVRMSLQWWLSQLAALVPVPLTDRLKRRREQLVLDVSKDELVIGRIGTRFVEIFRTSIPQGRESGGAIDGAPAAPPESARVLVRLPPGTALRRKIELPLAAEGKLREVLTHELERQTPYLADQVFFDWRILARHVKTRRLSVELAVVPRVFVERALALARRCNMDPQVIGIQTDRLAPPQFNFLAAAGPSERVQARPVSRALACVAILLAVSIPFAWTWRHDSALRQVQAETAAARRDAQASEALRRRIDQLERQSDFLVTKQQSPRLVEVLYAVTRLLPKDTWVFSFALDGDHGQLTGYSPAASKLIGLFAASPLFTDARFDAPLTQGPKPGLERFELSVDLRKPSP